ncbi:YggS family pyridoxal phosphate-dependent enzyme [Ilyomonas limi]|uniref:Pyridoxal phosphate homeostasis protein n=1 Tax=Ilyomonas limi TaxID=2575867 RepID=A0A4U3KYE2_9BACT|nr:YggS family pyridoxal phosphate-dependent enzyme [Ilyomonas limi]TKK67382.1 YggS family pyridoxal phosphate-dependent enzyme [Ilyomonas limi]
MAINEQQYKEIKNKLNNYDATLVAVSKTKPIEDIQALYAFGQRDFGENYVQELTDKQSQLPNDIRWHFIGHLQSNKVKYIAPFVHLIHGVDDYKLLREINKQAAKHKRVIDCLLQVHIAQEETKFGLSDEELKQIINEVISNPSALNNICIKGLMGMASNTDDEHKTGAEFRHLKGLFDKYAALSTSNFRLSILSMGMSSDYIIALEEGSTMVRIGSLLFGARDYSKAG